MLEDDKRQAALRLLRAYAVELRTEIEQKTKELSRELARIERGIAELSGEEASRPDLASPTGKYGGLGPQGAVEMFLKEHPRGVLRPSEIAKQLKADGFTVSNPKLLNTQVSVALRRAQAKGLVEVVHRGRTRAFRSVRQDET